MSVADVETKIEAAFKRSAELDARRIRVGAIDGRSRSLAASGPGQSVRKPNARRGRPRA